MGDVFALSWPRFTALSAFLALWLHSPLAILQWLSPFQCTSGVRNGYLFFTRNFCGVRLSVWAGTENWSVKKKAARHSLLSSFSCLSLSETNCQHLYSPSSCKNTVARLLPCTFYFSTGVQNQLLCVMITMLHMRRLSDKKIKCFTSEKSGMGQTAGFFDPETKEKSIWELICWGMLNFLQTLPDKHL